MGTHKTGLCSSQNAVLTFVLIGSLVTLTLAQVFTPKIAKEILQKHNEYRRQESASNMYQLHWNVSLQERADSWVQRCQFKHERNLDLGENLFFDTDHDNDVFARGMDEWHKEKSSWGYTSIRCLQACHFTQLVWGYTTTVGCSANVCPSLDASGRSVKNAMLFVCYYYPRGNFAGNFPYAKGRPCSECAPGDTCSDGLCLSSGPISKLAPDFVKSLAPLTPITLSRSRQSFQDFKSLIQQFSSETSQEGHHHRSHHRSEHHHAQQHHFQSQSVVSSGSESHSYSGQHSRVQQHHQQVYHSSHSQTYNQQRQHGERSDWLQEQTRIQQEEKRRQDLKEQENQKRLEVYNSNQRYHQQQSERNDWLKEQDRLQQQIEEKKRQELKEQENQKRIELEKSQQAIKEEQQKQAELERIRQHLLHQQRLQEERQKQIELDQKKQLLQLQQKRQEEQLEIERARKEEEGEDLKRLLQYRETHLRQVENERLRKLNIDQNRSPEEQDSDAYRRRQSTDYDFSKASVSQKEAKDHTRSETIKISLQPPAETFSASGLIYGDNLRKHLYTQEDQTKTTIGLNQPRQNQDSRYIIDGRNAHNYNYSSYDESYRWGVRNQVHYSSHVQQTMRPQSTTSGRVIKLLPIGNTDKASGGQISGKDYEVGSKSSWPGQISINRTTVQKSERIHGSSQTQIDSRGNSVNGREQPEGKIHGEDTESETDESIDEEEFEDDFSSLQKQRQREENRRQHLKKKWKHQPMKLKKIEDKHHHKEHYLLDSSGRRCVDRHVECIRWATKCYKSSAVTLACPMTCGKCGLHVDHEENLGEQDVAVGRLQRSDPDRAQRTKRRKNEDRQKLTPAEKKARRQQRLLDRANKAQQAPMAHAGVEEFDQKQRPRRTKEERKRRKEERKRRKEERKRERQQGKQAKEQQPLCRDDPKHTKSCKYWSKKGFCLENKLIENIYCQQSCGVCD